MVNDARLEPSLVLDGQPETAHREHRNHTRHHHLHLKHARLKPRQAGIATTVEQINSIVTVVQTLSYVQQIDVDSTGRLIMTQFLLTNAPAGFTAPTSAPASPTTSDDPESPAASSAASSAQPDSISAQSLPPMSSTPPSLPSTPSIPIKSSFPSLSASSNSTSTSSAWNSSSLCSNSTTTSSCSSSWSSLTYLTSTPSLSSTSSTPSSASSSALSSTFSLSSALATSTNTGGAVGGTTGAAPSNPSPSSTAAAGTSGSSTPPTSIVVGSVVGSVAGFAFLVLLILALVKWRKRKNMLSLGNGNDGGVESISRNLPPPAPAGGMIQRRSMPFVVPAALATLTGFGKRSSQRTERTVSTAPSERGFYRVSGRKLPSVLQTGGDGYGGDVHETNTLSRSFYGESTRGGPSQGPLASAGGINTDRDSGVPVMRPSPARTPVTEHGPFGASPVATPPPPLAPPRRLDSPDGLGRSHPSQDGSHTSRFTEQV